jgi:predicted DNA-binding protein
VKTISLKLPARLLTRLESASRARGTTKSSLARKCLEKLLYTSVAVGKVTCYDLAHDLAGSIKGLPHDLVTNRKHMEKLGR